MQDIRCIFCEEYISPILVANHFLPCYRQWCAKCKICPLCTCNTCKGTKTHDGIAWMELYSAKNENRRFRLQLHQHPIKDLILSNTLLLPIFKQGFTKEKPVCFAKPKKVHQVHHLIQYALEPIVNS